MEKSVDIYADGACRGNPGPGGWGALLLLGERERELSGYEAATTNNRMELTAVIRALEALTRPVKGRVYTDSQYVRKGVLEWMPNWKKRGWKTADKKPVKNQDLWEALDAATQRHELEWHWVKGHSGNVGNERVDALANQAIDAMVR
ncbi:MAG: ribonuclease HI [Pseudomonadota bacterium]